PAPTLRRWRFSWRCARCWFGTLSRSGSGELQARRIARRREIEAGLELDERAHAPLVEQHLERAGRVGLERLHVELAVVFTVGRARELDERARALGVAARERLFGDETG